MAKDFRTGMYVMQQFMQLGYNPTAAAAIVGNLDHESGLNPTIKGDHGTSFGIAQWHNERWNNMVNWTTKNGLNPNSIDGQVRFLDHELKTSYSGVYSALQNAKSLREATAAFTVGFERPAGSDKGAENSAGWGARYGGAVNYASMATGKPMSEFASSGYRPPESNAAGAPQTFAMPIAPRTDRGEALLPGATGDVNIAGDAAPGAVAAAQVGGVEQEGAQQQPFAMGAAPDVFTQTDTGIADIHNKLANQKARTQMGLAEDFAGGGGNLGKLFADNMNIGAGGQMPEMRKFVV
jgi:hypothetical protein